MVNHGLWSKQTMEQHGQPCFWFKEKDGLTWSSMVRGQNKPWNNTINHGPG